jgi:hypothetical protein
VTSKRATPTIVQLITMPDGTRVRTKLTALAGNPRPSGVVRLAGSEDEYRVRVGQKIATHRQARPGKDRISK